jgi:hypothetical protein
MTPFEFGRLIKQAVDSQGQTYRPPVLNSNARKQLANYQGQRPEWTAEDTTFAQGLLQQHYPKRYPNAQNMSPQDTWTATVNEAMVRPPLASMGSRGVNMRPAPVTPFMAAINKQRPQWKNAIPATPQPPAPPAPSPQPAQVAYDPNDPNTWMPTK